jgi:hypothetical protein
MAEIRALLEHIARGDATRQNIPRHLRDAFAEAERNRWLVDAGTAHSGHGNHDLTRTLISRVILTESGEAELARRRS